LKAPPERGKIRRRETLVKQQTPASGAATAICEQTADNPPTNSKGPTAMKQTAYDIPAYRERSIADIHKIFDEAYNRAEKLDDKKYVDAQRGIQLAAIDFDCKRLTPLNEGHEIKFIDMALLMHIIGYLRPIFERDPKAFLRFESMLDMAMSGNTPEYWSEKTFQADAV
jgi:hypothetical protein